MAPRARSATSGATVTTCCQSHSSSSVIIFMYLQIARSFCCGLPRGDRRQFSSQPGRWTPAWKKSAEAAVSALGANHQMRTMVSTFAYTARAHKDAAASATLVHIGIAAGLGLLVLPALVAASVRLLQPSDPTIARILAAETILIAAVQIALSIVVVRKASTSGIVRALIPALVAGLVVAAGDVAGLFAVDTAEATTEILSVLAYDMVLGVVLALPVVVVLQAASRCRAPARKADVDATPEALIAAYRGVLEESASPVPWHVRAALTHQLVRRHVRRTLEAVQRGYAKKAVERGLDEGEARHRQAMDDYLLSVPPVSRAVPIPTVATIFVLWKLVPVLVALAATAAAWFGGGRWGLATVSEPIGKVVPHEVTSLAIDALALAIAFPLLMLVLAPAIQRRDQLLAEYMVCEREVILMDDRLAVPRSSRQLEYVMAALPALPLVLYGGAVLAYALAGLFVYPSPEGPLGGLVERADLMHLGPVTGAVLAQAFLVAAAAWIAWIVKARKTTRVVFL
jgi:hypothetical protein